MLRLAALSTCSLMLLAAPAASASGIPAFARKYGVSCATCHAPIPRLNAVGERFAANGFEFAPGEEPRDTIATGDATLRLQRELPLAVRFDAYMTAISRRRGGQVVVDQQLPWVVKVLSGGQIADRISYYTYFLLSERGEVAGLEDAYVQFTDVARTGVDVIVGQFQVSDPMFKRELRLQYEDYQPYRIRVGHARPDLTYERGIMAGWSPWDGTDVVAQLVTGQGLRVASEDRQYDRDGVKNVALRLSQELGPVRLGVFGYRGAERIDGVRSSIAIVGPDVTIAPMAGTELNVQLLRRWDENPFFGSCDAEAPCPGGVTESPSTVVDAAMIELLWWPAGPAGRWTVAGLVNWVEADLPIVALRLGEQSRGDGFLRRYSTASGGVHYLLRRNIRLMTELGWDFDFDQARVVTGFSTAF